MRMASIQRAFGSGARAAPAAVLALTLLFAYPLAGAQEHEHKRSSEGDSKGAAAGGLSEAPGVTERLGESVALDAVLRDASGEPVRLGDLLTLPTLLLPVYFGCPNVCSFLQVNVAKILPRVDLEPGKEYQVISLSFDATETPAMARQAKADFLPSANDRWPGSAWRFLTGDEDNVMRAMDSIGFRFQRKDDRFVHPVVILALAPGGKIVRYLYGYRPLSFDVTMAMTEAGMGRQGLSVKRALAYCFSYDPEGRRYSLNVLRIAGITVAALAVILFLALVLGGRGKKRSKG